jgi:glutamine synthetase
LKEILERTKNIRFEKDGYSKEWQKDAKKRGLYVNEKLLTSLKELVVEKNTALFAKYDILTPIEMQSRYSAWCDLYCTNKLIEINVVLEMLENCILPDAIGYRTFLLNSYRDAKDVLEAGLIKSEKKLIKEYAEIIAELFTKKDELNDNKKIFRGKSELDAINYAYDGINPILGDIRELMDKLEKRTGDKFWSLLKYKDLLFF